MSDVGQPERKAQNRVVQHFQDAVGFEYLGISCWTSACRRRSIATMPTVVNVYGAKTHFSELLSRAEAGEEIVIARHGRPIVQLVAVASRPPDRVLGQAGRPYSDRG